MPHGDQVTKEISTYNYQDLKIDSILKEVINAHGGDLYTSAHYSFIFRGNTYTFKNDNKNFEYSKISKKGKVTTKDILKNGSFSRTVDGQTVALSPKKIKSGIGAINSVIYFATLPHKLSDEAVNLKDMGTTTIKGKNYMVLGVTFDQEGGGQDFEDQFHYWINTKTNKIDYLAYNYHVNTGGVRFRSAYNSRVIDGITFQDYVNFKAKLGTPLIELPKLYEQGKLKELSKIETEHIINLNNK